MACTQPLWPTICALWSAPCRMVVEWAQRIGDEAVAEHAILMRDMPGYRVIPHARWGLTRPVRSLSKLWPSFVKMTPRPPWPCTSNQGQTLKSIMANWRNEADTLLWKREDEAWED